MTVTREPEIVRNTPQRFKHPRPPGWIEQPSVTSGRIGEATGDTASQPALAGAYAMERHIASLESENESMRERIAELEHANRILATGVSQGYWRTGTRLKNIDARDAAAPVMPEPTSPFELGPERQKGKPV